MSKNLLYKPQLDYEKNYYTEGDLYNSNINSNDNVENLTDNDNNKLNNMKDLIEDIKTKLPVVPKDILDVFLPPFLVITDVVNGFDDDKNNNPNLDPNKPNGSHEIEPPKNDIEFDNDDDIPDDPFGREDDVYIDVKVDDINKIEELEYQYVDDLKDVLLDYLMEYNRTLDKYISNTITNLTYSHHDNLKIVTTDILHDKNLSHLTDYLTKSQIGARQQLLLYKKMFDIDETIFHIKSVKIANEQRKRYRKNKKLEDKNTLTKGANDLLKESIMISEKKYEENFYSLYKYLNSSVILFNECMNTVIKQKRMLVLLNNKEREK